MAVHTTSILIRCYSSIYNSKGKYYCPYMYIFYFALSQQGGKSLNETKLRDLFVRSLESGRILNNNGDSRSFVNPGDEIRIKKEAYFGQIDLVIAVLSRTKKQSLSFLYTCHSISQPMRFPSYHIVQSLQVLHDIWHNAHLQNV